MFDTSTSNTLRAKLAPFISSARSQNSWERVDSAQVTRLQRANYDVVRASVPLMKAAIQNLPIHSSVGEIMIPYLEHHIKEERNHAAWLADDLTHVNVDVFDRPPSVLAAGVVGPQYYWITHDHPVSLLGYMVVLESYTTTVDMVEAFIARTNYPRAALRTLLHHAAVDPQHSTDLFNLIDSLPLTKEHEATIGVSALYTVAGLSALAAEAITEP